MEASLVMQDRQTDSWWSIMTSDALAGPLEGTLLIELPYGEKTTWGDWRRRYPDSLVLSVAGREHVAVDPYADYFASEKTFRELDPGDRRLAPKTPIYAFFLDGTPWAAPHEAFAGGVLFEVDEADRQIYLHREEGSSLFASSTAFTVDPGTFEGALSAAAIQERIESGDRSGLAPLAGIDTYWYTWVAVNEGSRLVHRSEGAAGPGPRDPRG